MKLFWANSPGPCMGIEGTPEEPEQFMKIRQIQAELEEMEVMGMEVV